MVSEEEANMSIKDFLKSKVPEVEKRIEEYIPRKASADWIEKTLGETIFELDLNAYNKGVNEPIWDLLDRGGKRFRPIMTCIVAEALGGSWNDAMKLAPIIELIHNGCVEEDALVWMADGTSKKMKDVQVGDYVISVDKLGQLKERRVSFKYNNGVKKVLKVESNNRTLSATEEHPFLVVEKAQPYHYKVTDKVKEKLKNILIKKKESSFSLVKKAFKKSDFGGVNQRAIFNALRGYKNCFLPEEFVDYLVEEYKLDWNGFEKSQGLYEKANVSLKWKRAKNLTAGDILIVGKNVYSAQGELPLIPIIEKSFKDRYSLPTEMTLELAQLCGFIVGDGHIAKDKVELCIPDFVQGRKEYEELAKKLFCAEPSKYKERITLCSIALVNLFTYLGLNENHLKIKIPDWVFKLPKEYKLAFINGYIDADGSVGKIGNITLAAANKELISQFKMLLDSIGFITGNLHEREVSNEHFANSIKKRTTLYTLSINQAQATSITSFNLCESLVGKNKVLSKQVMLRQEEKVPSLPAQLNFEQLGFVEVRNVIEQEPVQTYDIEVDETHSYICNGIVVHNTLMSDDVEDDSVARRGKPCIHKIYGVDTAVNTGAIMYFWPMAKIVNNDFDLTKEQRIQIYDLYITEMIRVSSGQAWDIEWHHGGYTPSEAQYLNMCLGKTGVLTRFACQLGAIIGGATKEQYDALGKFGQIVGVGFQIQDDILELTESDFKKGKGSVGGDIHEGKRTLIIIRTLSQASQVDKERLIKILDSHTTKEEEIKEALEIINRYDGISYSKKRAEELVLSAWEKVNGLIKESNAKTLLKKFAEYLVDRKI